MPGKEEEKDALTIAIENNSCGICRAMGLPICKGHGGGGDSGKGSDESKDKDVANTSNQAIKLAQLTPDSIQLSPDFIKELDKFKTAWVQSTLSSDRAIDYEAGLFSIESDRLRGNLSFHIKSGLSRDEIEAAREFLKAVKTEFEEFKNQLTEQDIPTQNFSAHLKDNELTVHIPIPNYYDAFIKHLQNNNLLPTPNPKREEKKETLQSAKQDEQQTFNPNPLSTRFERK